MEIAKRTNKCTRTSHTLRWTLSVFVSMHFYFGAQSVYGVKSLRGFLFFVLKDINQRFRLWPCRSSPINLAEKPVRPYSSRTMTKRKGATTCCLWSQFTDSKETLHNKNWWQDVAINFKSQGQGCIIPACSVLVSLYSTQGLMGLFVEYRLLFG